MQAKQKNPLTPRSRVNDYLETLGHFGGPVVRESYLEAMQNLLSLFRVTPIPTTKALAELVSVEPKQAFMALVTNDPVVVARLLRDCFDRDYKVHQLLEEILHPDCVKRPPY